MLTIAIQAGGESSRMGQEKALALFLGKPLIQRVFERVTGLGEEMLVTTNHPEAFGFLGVRLVPDLLPGMGALGGLYTALSAASHPLAAVVACDMPFVNPQLLLALRDRLVESDCDAAVPRSPNGVEPFHAVYRCQRCLPLIGASLQGGQRRVEAWFATAKIAYFSPTEAERFDPDQRAFMNLNTQAELRQAEEQARGEP